MYKLITSLLVFYCLGFFDTLVECCHMAISFLKPITFYRFRVNNETGYFSSLRPKSRKLLMKINHDYKDAYWKDDDRVPFLKFVQWNYEMALRKNNTIVTCFLGFFYHFLCYLRANRKKTLYLNGRPIGHVGYSLRNRHVYSCYCAYDIQYDNLWFYVILNGIVLDSLRENQFQDMVIDLDRGSQSLIDTKRRMFIPESHEPIYMNFDVSIVRFILAITFFTTLHGYISVIRWLSDWIININLKSIV